MFLKTLFIIKNKLGFKTAMYVCHLVNCLSSDPITTKTKRVLFLYYFYNL